MSSMASSPYEILGVTLDSSPEEIQQAWRKLIKENHPDNFRPSSKQQKVAHQKAASVNEAYRALKSPRKQKVTQPPKAQNPQPPQSPKQQPSPSSSPRHQQPPTQKPQPPQHESTPKPPQSQQPKQAQSSKQPQPPKSQTPPTQQAKPKSSKPPDNFELDEDFAHVSNLPVVTNSPDVPVWVLTTGGLGVIGGCWAISIGWDTLLAVFIVVFPLLVGAGIMWLNTWINGDL